jgi:hypothetical protein
LNAITVSQNGCPNQFPHRKHRLGDGLTLPVNAVSAQDIKDALEQLALTNDQLDTLAAAGD